MARNQLSYCFVGVGILLLLCGCPPPSEIIHVPADYSTIQAAIDAALDDALILIADGVYTGPGNKNLYWDATTKHIKIESENGPENCIIDCDYDGRAFILNQGQNRGDVIKGLTMRNGWVRNPTGVTTGGGAILCDAASPQIRNCILINNVAGDVETSSSISYWTDGGAIDCINGSNPLIIGNRIEHNYANHTGGGIHFAHSTGSVENNFIMYNVNRGCYGGGGISLLGGSNPEIINNVIAHNTAEYYGDGGYGGGIICMNSNPFIVNNTIVYNSTRTDLSNGEGGGIRIRGLPYPVIANCIIRNNLSGQDLENIDFQYPGSKLNISYCDIENGIGNILTDYAWTIFDLNPFFVDAANDNFDLLSLSPCIDSGTPDLSLIPYRLFDLAGNSRISGSRIDIGAYEYQH